MPDDKEYVDCAVTFTAIDRTGLWEGSCTCGWWTKGTKKECERLASGHPPRKEFTER